MRIGSNPNKDVTVTSPVGRHRIIVPVYIPHFEGYFQHSFEVLKLSLESLYLTVGRQVAITVVSNGCAPEVVAELERQQHAGRLDQLVLNRENIGKIDAVISIARGSFEPLLTITDCDVLFRSGWLEAVEQLFQDFPECGFASPFPNPAGEWYYTSVAVLGGLLRRELGFERITDYRDLDRFAHSIGRENMYAPDHHHGQLIVRRGAATARIGCGHFVCTLRREVLPGMPPEPSQFALGGGSDHFWLDRPPDKLGYWRLATTTALVSHMGNHPEPWMYEELEQVKHAPPPPPREAPPLRPAHPSVLRFVPLRIREALLRGCRALKLRDFLARNVIQQAALHISTVESVENK